MNLDNSLYLCRRIQEIIQSEYEEENYYHRIADHHRLNPRQKRRVIRLRQDRSNERADNAGNR